ncbi:hypothetical protein Tco_0531585 [Tanacetum coccineum]
MVRIEALTDDRLAGKISILHCLLISYGEGGGMLARYRGLESQVSGLKKQVTDLNDKATASDARFDAQKGDHIAAAKTYLDDIYALIGGYKHSLAEKDTKILRLKASPPEFASFFRGRLVKATPLVATNDYPFLNKVADHSAHPLSAIVELEPDRLACLTVIPTPRVVGVSPPLPKELTITPAPSLVEFAIVDKTDEEMVDATFEKPMEVFVQGVAHSVCKDVNRIESSSIQESGFASSGSADVVIALFVREKERGSLIPQMFLLLLRLMLEMMLPLPGFNWMV